MAPRIPPVSLDGADDRAREQLERVSEFRGDDVTVLNIFGTLGHHPDLMRRWLVFGNHVLSKSTLSGRDRELAILRAGWRCRAPYEWGQHVVIARREGITDEEIAQIAEGPDAAGWSPHEAAILRTVDELHDTSTVSDATWSTLVETFSPQQCMDLVFAIGQYHLVSYALNAFRVERDDGVDTSAVPFPEPAG
ncbi:MAG: carboxymuconolactone decarboxylase family protein [Actinobacteria bacterium]|nr:carboxymuconolactone decarboxylase family protein [Actinomycetota bacterium]